MGISKSPSALTLPVIGKPYPTLAEFLARTFPHVPEGRWRERLRDGKVLDEHGTALTATTGYRPGLRIYYFRETEEEPVIPFAEEILFQNDQILVACKPHFLPVVPGGRFVNECLTQRLRNRSGCTDLVPLHRIDRDTAGLVLCSLNPGTRGLYHDLFVQGRIEKTYEAIATVHRQPRERSWLVENRLVPGEPRFRMRAAPGAVNARSEIHLEAIDGDRAQFRLHPITGKTHQLRVHMSGIGFPIVNDRYYPELQAETAADFTRPLQLIARELRFRDPVGGVERTFRSNRVLLAGTLKHDAPQPNT